MFDGLYFTIRWRWLLAGVATVFAVGLIVVGIHEYQISRIGERLLHEARQAAVDGNTAVAKQQFRAYLSLVADDAAAQEEYAQLILSEPRTVENDLTVMELLDSAVRNGSASRETRLELIRTAVRLERYVAADTLLDGIDPQQCSGAEKAELLATKGLCCLKKGDFKAAARACRAALKADGGCSMAWQSLIEITDAKEGLPTAIRMAEQMVAEVSTADSHAIRARLLAKSNDRKGAGAAYRSAATAKDSGAETAQEFADFIMYDESAEEEMDLDMVQAAYDALLQSSETMDYMTAARLADLAHRLRQYPTAIAHYQRCLELKPGDSFAIGRTTEVLAESGRFDEAHKMLDSMSGRKSLTLLRNTLRASLFAEQERFRDASDLLEGVLDVSGDHNLRQNACFLLVDCLWEQERYERAILVGRELLKLTEGSDDSREQLVQSLIYAEHYDQVVHQLQLFRSTEEYVDRNLSLLIQSARANNQMARLKKHIDKNRSLRTSSPLPVIFEAYQLADSGETSGAVRLLAGSAADNPDVVDYWNSLSAVRTRFRDQSNHTASATPIAQIKDPDERLLYAMDLLSHDLTSATARFNDYFAATPASLEPLQLVADVLEQTTESTETRQLFLKGIHQRLTAALNRHGLDAVPALDRIFVAGGHGQEAFQLLSSAVAQSDSHRVLQTFCRNIGVPGRTDLYATERIRTQLEDGSLKCTETGRAIILAELESRQSDMESAVQRLRILVKRDPANDAAVTSLLRLSGYHDTLVAGLAELGFRLLKKHPHDPDILIAVSCGLRAEHRYAESAHYAREAFAAEQNPTYLLHAAYTEWLADRTDRARDLLRLACRAGLSETDMHTLDRTLLHRLQTDPKIQESVTTQNDRYGTSPNQPG